MKTFSVRLSDEMHALLSERCEQIGLTKNALMVIALKAYLEQDNSLLSNSSINNKREHEHTTED